MAKKPLFNKGDDIWTVVDLNLMYANVVEVCTEGDDILYRTDREIYTLSVHPHPYFIRSDVAYTEETANSVLIKQLDEKIDEILDVLMDMYRKRKVASVRLKEML